MEDKIIDLELKDGVYVLPRESETKKGNKNVWPRSAYATGKNRSRPAAVASPLNDIFEGIKLGVSIFRTVRKGFK